MPRAGRGGSNYLLSETTERGGGFQLARRGESLPSARMDSALSDLFTVLRFPSISTSSEHAGSLRECADWIAAKLTGMGLTTTVHPTKRHPVVVAKSKPVPGRPTVLIYGHYDVQPVDPLDQWTSPPFEPVLKDGRIFARGATDNKVSSWRTSAAWRRRSAKRQDCRSI